MAAPRFRKNADGSTTYGVDTASTLDDYTVSAAGNVLTGAAPRNWWTASKETVTDPRWMSGDFANRAGLQAPAAWFDTKAAHPEFTRTATSADAEGGWNQGLTATLPGDFVQMGTRYTTGGPDSQSEQDGPASGYARDVWTGPGATIRDTYDKDGKFTGRSVFDPTDGNKMESAVFNSILSFLGMGWLSGVDQAVQAEDSGDEGGIYKGLLKAYASTGGPYSEYAGMANSAIGAYDAYQNKDWVGVAQNANSAYNAYNAAGNSGTTGKPGTTGVSDFRAGEIGSYQTDGSLTGPAVVGGNQSNGDWSGGFQGNQQSGGNMFNTGYFDDGQQNDWDSNSGNDSSSYDLSNFLSQYQGEDPSWWDSLLSGNNANGLLGGALKLYNGLGGNKALGGLLGAYLGYKDGKDGKQMSSQSAPWSPAQPYLEGLFREGADLFNQQKAQPFSPAEQTAYGNYGGLLDTINRGAGGLMQGFDVTASGGNQFVRGKPRNGTLIGAAFEPTAETWNPGLLGNFGTTPPRKKVA